MKQRRDTEGKNLGSGGGGGESRLELSLSPEMGLIYPYSWAVEFHDVPT